VYKDSDQSIPVGGYIVQKKRNKEGTIFASKLINYTLLTVEVIQKDSYVSSILKIIPRSICIL